jgi:hypothetical protein
MAERNPSKNIDKLREGGADVIVDTDLSQSDPGSDSRYPLGNSTFSVDIGGPDWPTPRGIITTSKTDTYFATQTFTPIGEYDYYQQRKWDDSVIAPDETGSPAGGLNLTRWKGLTGTNDVSTDGENLVIHTPDASTQSAFRSNYYVTGNDYDLVVNLDFNAMVPDFIGTEVNNSETRWIIGFPIYWSGDSRIDNTNYNLGDWSACFHIYWDETQDRFVLQCQCYNNGSVRQQGNNFYNSGYKWWRIRWLSGTWFFYAKVNEEDNWTQVASQNYRLYGYHRAYTKVHGGHPGVSGFLSPKDFKIGELNIGFNSSTLTWEIPTTGLWSTWRKITDSDTAAEEALTVAQEEAASAVTAHEGAYTHTQIATNASNISTLQTDITTKEEAIPKQDTAPSSPSLDDLWIDTSS